MSLGRIVIHIECGHCRRRVMLEEHQLQPAFRKEKLRCRRCGQRKASVQLVWHQGTPPNNVVDRARYREGAQRIELDSHNNHL
jgi:hypothetical protein